MSFIQQTAIEQSDCTTTYTLYNSSTVSDHNQNWYCHFRV